MPAIAPLWCARNVVGPSRGWVEPYGPRLERFAAEFRTWLDTSAHVEGIHDQYVDITCD